MVPRNCESFTFIGFLPKSELQIKNIIAQYTKQNLVFYDSPERIIKTLQQIKEIRGDIMISLGRELSKLFEEVLTDKITNVLKHYKDGIRGEIVCMVFAEESDKNIDLDADIRKLQRKGFKNKEISVILSELFDINKNDIYRRVLELS